MNEDSRIHNPGPRRRSFEGADTPPRNRAWTPRLDDRPINRRRDDHGRTQSRATWKPANDWLTGISSSALMFRWAGRVATQNRVSAMSSPVMG